MKVLVLLALGLVASASSAQANVCHQGYEYKMTRTFGKVAYVATGRRCVFKSAF